MRAFIMVWYVLVAFCILFADAENASGNKLECYVI